MESKDAPSALPVPEFSAIIAQLKKRRNPLYFIALLWPSLKRKRGSKIYMAVDTLGLLLAVHITPANDQERAQVAELGRQVQQATGQTVKLAFAAQGYTADTARQVAHDEGIELQIIKLREAKKGFVLLPRRWVVSVGSTDSGDWRDYERLPETLAGLHFVVFAMLMLVHVAPTIQVPNTLWDDQIASGTVRSPAASLRIYLRRDPEQAENGDRHKDKESDQHETTYIRWLRRTASNSYLLDRGPLTACSPSKADAIP
ncbi:transposase [Paraburkholderia sp. WSM4179]|nr:transposase [Paraburkholderia sp. WSM4179]